jgi:hypothetical protein
VLIGALFKKFSPLFELSNIYIYLYINNLPQRINSVSEPILFADHTGVTISSRIFEDFCTMSNLVLPGIIKWFAASILVLNLDKTNIIIFIKSYSSHSILYIGYKSKVWTVNTNFLGIQVDNHINWKNHMEQMVPKLSAVCYAVGSMVRSGPVRSMSVTLTFWNQFTMHTSIELQNMK